MRKQENRTENRTEENRGQTPIFILNFFSACVGKEKIGVCPLFSSCFPDAPLRHHSTDRPLQAIDLDLVVRLCMYRHHLFYYSENGLEDVTFQAIFIARCGCDVKNLVQPCWLQQRKNRENLDYFSLYIGDFPPIFQFKKIFQFKNNEQ